MTLLYILLTGFGIMLISLSGIVFVSKTLHGWAERNLKYLTSFSTGVFFVIAYNLISEITASHLSTSSLLLAIAGGLLIAFGFDKLLPDSHHHHGSGEEPHKHSKAGAQRIMFSDTLHNFTDGFLIVPAFLIDVKLGLLTALGIAVHEIAQEISEFFVLKSAGYSNTKALSINFISSSAIMLGLLSSYLIASSAEELISTLLAIAAGIIIYTILRDLIPHSVRHAHNEKTYLNHAGLIILGIVVVLSLSQIAGEEHSHESEHEPDTSFIQQLV